MTDRRCYVCGFPAKFQEDTEEERCFCGRECQLSAPIHDDYMPDDDLVALIESDNVDEVKAWIEEHPMTRNQMEALLTFAETTNMARLFIRHFGVDPYAYVEDGQVGFDYMLYYRYPIREFLRFIDEPFPESIGNPPIVIGDTLIEIPVTIHTVEEFCKCVNHGWFPYNMNSDIMLILEHIFFQRYNSDTIRFWFDGLTYNDCIGQIKHLYGGTLEAWKRESTKKPFSWPFMILDPSYLYKRTKHPKNDMGMFRTADSTVLDAKPDNSYSVVRYAQSLETGQFHESLNFRFFCGTFYYVEHPSTTVLRYSYKLVANNKVDALRKLLQVDDPMDILKKIPRMTPGTVATFSMIISKMTSMGDSRLLFTPSMFLQWTLKNMSAERYNTVRNSMIGDLQMDRECYAAKQLGLYALEDPLDQMICNIAHQQGYDCVMLSNMVGSRQIVSEVLDVRSRSDSFRSLAWLN